MWRKDEFNFFFILKVTKVTFDFFLDQANTTIPTTPLCPEGKRERKQGRKRERSIEGSKREKTFSDSSREEPPLDTPDGREESAVFTLIVPQINSQAVHCWSR